MLTDQQKETLKLYREKKVLAWSPHLVTDSTVFDYMFRKRDESGVMS